MKHLVALGLLILLTLVLVTGCGGGATGAGSVIKSGSKMIRGVGDAPPPGIPRPNPGSIGQAIPKTTTKVMVEELATAGNDVSQARQAFANLRTGDAYDQLFASAVCTGMEWLAEQDGEVSVSEDAWEEFLKAYPENYAQNVVQGAAFGYAEQEWLGRVAGVKTTWDLAQVNGAETRVYYRACVAQ